MHPYLRQELARQTEAELKRRAANAWLIPLRHRDRQRRLPAFLRFSRRAPITRPIDIRTPPRLASAKTVQSSMVDACVDC